MKRTLVALVLFVSSWSMAGNQAFPTGPDLSLTPGALCDTPTQYRYPEHIPYCRRDVESGLKQQIFVEYDEKLGYHTRQIARNQFKIDHYIPLCAGGSNEQENLWPQHESVYKVTDPMEPLVCEKMAAGRLKQADAIVLIREGKADLSKVPEILRHLQSL